MDEYKKISFIYNPILSKSPDIYTQVTRRKEDHPSFWNNSDYREIGYSIYKEIWDEKSKNNSTPVQQHSPTENTMGSKERVYKSLEFMAASYI